MFGLRLPVIIFGDEIETTQPGKSNPRSFLEDPSIAFIKNNSKARLRFELKAKKAKKVWMCCPRSRIIQTDTG